MTTTEICDLQRLDQFLDGALDEAGEGAVTLHLDTCSDCRSYLEQQAAAPQSWQEAGELLSFQEFDQSANEIFRPTSLMIGNVLDALAPTDDPSMLGRMGGMEVSGVVGAGAMGVVLKAFDRSLDRPVAIKVLAPHLASSGAARARFSREAKAAAAVLHPNVMAIHSVSNDGPLPWLVMPYVRGDSLQKRLNEHGQMSIREVLRVGAQVAAGLAAAHAQGLVHRDIKPANIMLEDGVERVAITDFGLARAVDDATMTCSGIIAGTPQYMSPEQARGEAIDQRSDLFSLGSVLYTMCTGRAPFRAETTFGVLRRITDDEPRPIAEVNADLPVWLSEIIARLMSKNPNDRFESASQVAQLLEECLAHLEQPESHPLPDSLGALSSRGGIGHWNLTRILGAAAAGAALIALGIVLLLEWNKGTLVIECEAADVPIQILQGDAVVEQLTVTKQETSLRIAAGKYVVRIDGNFDGLVVDRESVTVSRGNRKVVSITQRDSVETSDVDLTSAEPAEELGISRMGLARPRRVGEPVQGTILEARDDLFVVSVGADDGIRPGLELIVFRENRYLGRVRVVQVEPDRSVVAIRETRADVTFRAGDEVASTLDQISGAADEGQPIYNDQLKRFKFRLEKAQVSNSVEAGAEFLVRYRDQKNAPVLYAAWGDPDTNSIVVIGPAEADQAIRNTLARWEGLSLGLDIPSAKVESDAKGDAEAVSLGHGPLDSVGGLVQPEVLSASGSGAVGRLADGTGPPAKAQLHVSASESALLFCISEEVTLRTPVRIERTTGSVSRFRLYGMPARGDAELYMTIELAERVPETNAFISHNAIPIKVTDEDIDHVLAGNMLTRVIYLPNDRHASQALAGVESLVITRLDSDVNAMTEARRRGSVLAVLRMGNRRPATLPEPSDLMKSEFGISDELWDFVGLWERASQRSGSMHGKLTYRVYDRSLCTEELSVGEFWHERPSDLRVDLKPARITPEMQSLRSGPKAVVERREDGTPYDLKPGTQDVVVVCRGQQIVIIDRDEQDATVITPAHRDSGAAFTDRVLPLIRGVNREDLFRRFRLEFAEGSDPDSTHVELKLIPRLSRDRMHWRELSILLDSEFFVPGAVRWVDSSGTRETRVAISEFQSSAAAPLHPIHAAIWEPDLTGVTVHRDEQPESSDVILPKLPVYGGRDPATGTLRLNPDWAEPAYDLLVQADKLVVEGEFDSVTLPVRATNRGDARQIIGLVTALVQDKDLKWNGESRVLTIETDARSVAIARLLLPMAAARLQGRKPHAVDRPSGKDTDVAVLEYQVSELRRLGTANLLSGEEHLFESARWFWDLSMSIDNEARLRKQAEQLAMRIQAAKMTDGRGEGLAELETKLDELVAEVDNLAGLRAGDQMFREQRQRTLDRAKSSAGNVHVVTDARANEEAVERARELKRLLREIDPDSHRLASLRQQILDARAGGRHEVADRLKAEADELTRALDARYSESPAGSR